MVSHARRQALMLLPMMAVFPVILGAELYRSQTQPSLRMVCERVDSDPSGLTVRVVKASHLDGGTTFSIRYGDGTTDGHSDGSPGRAKATHTYRAHGSYDVRAQMHLPSNQLRDYSRTCEV